MESEVVDVQYINPSTLTEKSVVIHGPIRLGLTITQLNHKVNDDDTNIRGKEYKSEKAKVLIARASGLPGVPTLGPRMSCDLPDMEIT